MSKFTNTYISKPNIARTILLFILLQRLLRSPCPSLVAQLRILHQYRAVCHSQPWYLAPNRPHQLQWLTPYQDRPPLQCIARPQRRKQHQQESHLHQYRRPCSHLKALVYPISGPQAQSQDTAHPQCWAWKQQDSVHKPQPLGQLPHFL